MNINHKYACLVDSTGKLIEWDDKAGKAYLSQFQQLVSYAKALLHSPLQQLKFYYHLNDNQWLFVVFQQYKQDYCLVEMQQTELPFALSKRELEILTLISCGLSNAEIASQLYISERTVAKHIQHLFEKTAIENRTILAVLAIQQNLCCLPTPGRLSQLVLATQQIEQLAQSEPQAQAEPQIASNVFSIKTERQRPITIGVPYVERGIGQIDSLELLNGSRLAIENINRQGGINGREVRLETVGFCFDQPESIQRCYQQLFDQEVEAISASYACYSPELHELVAQSGIPYLHLATHSQSNKLAQNFSLEKIDNIFQVCASDIHYSLGVMRFLQEYQYYYKQFIKNKKILLVNVKWQWIDIGIDRLISDLRAQGWSVEVLELTQSADVFQQLMINVHNLAPEMIILASYFAEDVVNFYQAFIQNPINAIIYSIYAPSALLPTQQPCEGVLWASTTGLSMNYNGQQFCRDYQQFFGCQPGYSQASVAYDQIQILANVWRSAVSPRHFSEVLTGLRTLPYHGVNGTYYFGSEQQIGLTYPDNTQDLSISQPHLIYQVQQGKSRVIAPQLFAETSFKLPFWFHIKS